MINLQPIAAYIQQQLTRMMNLPTSSPEWEGIEVDTSHIGPRITEQQPVGLRLSHGMDCARRLWYLHNEPDKYVPPNATVQLEKFSFGDLWECVAHQVLARCMPDGWTYLDAQDLPVKVVDITGHLDGLMVNTKGDVIVTDCKATSSFQVEKTWKDGHPDFDFGYMAQCTNYMFGVQAMIEDGEAPEWLAVHRPRKVIGFLWPCHVKQKYGLGTYTVGHAHADDPALRSYGKQVVRKYHDARCLPAPPKRWDKDKMCRYCSLYEHCRSDPR